MSAGPLEHRTAVVTGAGRGIGRALAEALAAAGAAVVVSSRTAADLTAVTAAIAARGGTAEAVVADALDREEARLPVRRAVETFGRLDILVNNVGGRGGTGPDDFERLLTLNLTTAWWTTSAALPVMRARRYGRIINIGSGLSERAGASFGYTAAKHGLAGLTRALAQATGAEGITVNCLCPGWTATSGVDLAAPGARERAEAENAQRRVLDAAELGPVAVLLASPAGAAVTGQVWHVDGGWKL
ncbi:SDR family NAD(P)-dependent oxidoreductase [Dactylosporangium sp. CS-033363]|uniref:SDR family NAD(P)-dependent oxidoreductase n=1 Tax=Dactylosporangium sp. CS-033363 TaxID=3239935 RepID=UPI003D94F214